MCIYPHRRNQCIWMWMWLTHEHRWELLMGLKICGVIRTASWNSIKAFTALQMSRHPPRTGSQGDKDAMTVSNEVYSKTAIWMACATHCNLSDGNPIFWYQLIPISHCDTMMDNATTDYMRTGVCKQSCSEHKYQQQQLKPGSFPYAIYGSCEVQLSAHLSEISNLQVFALKP